MAPAACGGGGRGRSPLSPLLGCLVIFSLLCTVCRGQDPGQLQPLPALEVATYNYTSFQEGNSREQRELAFSREARIYQGAIQVSPDTGNVGSYQDIMVNKSGSVLLQRRFTMWRRVDVDGGGNGNGSATAPRVQVVSFNSTFSMNVFHLPDSSPRPGEGLTFVVAPSRDEPPPGSYGGYLGLTNATLESSPAARNRFVAVEFDTTKQDYDPSDNHVGLNVGSVVSFKTANLTAFRIATDSASPRNYTAWVEYDGAARHVSVYMAVRGETKPASPVLDSPLDLSEHVPEQAYIGFTASTGTDFELNCILDWTLSIEVIPEKKSTTWVVIVAVVVPVTVVAVGVAAFFLARKLRARRSMERRQERLEQQLSNLPGMPRGFAYDKLKKATRNFDERLRLGKGGYGMVYKGVLPADEALPEGMDVAVKRFIRDDGKDVTDFLQEVDIINRLRHKNIVPLIGWCYKKGQLLLVYEFMPNGSLEQHLFRRGVHEQRWPVLSWARRYAIVGDVAAGLHYVHHEYTRMVLHRDVKASNVLLDASFRARLGDFGLARVLDDDREAFTDLQVNGTRGFIAPEYSVGHKASRETDVFAFGALVLEVVTGQLALRSGDPRCPLLSDWVWQMHGRGALLGAVDQSLGADEFDHDEAARLLLLALACSSPNPGDRPTMPQVLQVLTKAAPPPEVPPFKPRFVWPPEGGANFQLSDVEVTTSGTGTDDGVSTRATQSTSYDSFQPHTAPNSSDSYFPALSSGR
ncbi:probable L-type lectin-domain containing receptor kinase S.5 [Miscanthus floridulus]|uniref:probable L-type lectin-domain containing receptor kinase S.5 n=1 Tax=Miscanthus floridulus TaxID=154761 RepID=UPI00345A818A